MKSCAYLLEDLSVSCRKAEDYVLLLCNLEGESGLLLPISAFSAGRFYVVVEA